MKQETDMCELSNKFQAAVGPSAWSERIRDPSTFVQLIVNCQKLVPVTILDSEELLRSIEVDSSTMLQTTPEKTAFI